MTALELGAAGFIPKRFGVEEMVRALRLVLVGGTYVPEVEDMGIKVSRSALRALDTDPRLSALTERQLEVYRAVARGLPNKLVARELGIAESTVKSHLSVVFATLGVRNRTEALYMAWRDRPPTVE